MMRLNPPILPPNWTFHPENSLKRFCIDELKGYDINPSNADRFEDVDAMSVFVIYLNFIERLITKQARKVHLSKHLKKQIKKSNFGNALTSLFQEIEHGEDLSRYLSTGIQHALPSETQNSHRDRDLMLNNWGIHHLHISNEDHPKHGKKFSGRSDDLLFGMFTPSDAYLIGVFSHGNWANRECLEIVYDNWPDEGLLHISQNMSELSWNPTSQDVASLREISANSCFEYKGKVFYPKNSVTMSGHVSAHVDLALYIMRTLKQFYSKSESMELRRGIQPEDMLHADFWFDVNTKQFGLSYQGKKIILSNDIYS